MRLETQRIIHKSWKKIMRQAKRRGFSLAPNLPRELTLLGESQKTQKGEAIGVLTKILYLAPADSSGIDLCPRSTPECRASCLGEHSGKLALADSKNARAWKTALYIGDRELFLRALREEIAAHEKSARRAGMVPAVRLDGSSDTSLGLIMAPEFPNVSFYDYTKIVEKTREIPENYSLCYSYTGYNDVDALSVLESGGTVSVVFTARKNQSLPLYWRDYRVVDGDETDARFLDEKGVVVGLRFKGNKLALAGAFAVQTKVFDV